MKIVYVGGGFVGLTGGVHHALSGSSVIIYDVDKDTVNKINAGVPRAGEFLSYMNDTVKQLVDQKRLTATTDWNLVKNERVFIIGVPTEKDGQPYDVIVEKVLHDIIQAAVSETTILVESTLTPGTIDKVLSKETKKPGIDFHLAVCPRRDFFSQQDKNLGNLTRIVGGVTSACTEKAVNILSGVSKDIRVTDYKTAEIVKALENALLHVQVMFAHELALSMPDKNIAEAVKLATTHWRLSPLYLSTGSSGRCVPLGSRYLADATSGKLRMACWASHVDWFFRQAIVNLLCGNTPVTGSILVMGVAYNVDCKDLGNSAGLQIAKELKKKGRKVVICDPLWDNSELEKICGLPVVTTLSCQYDSILLVTPHTKFLSLPESITGWRANQFILDGRGAWSCYKSLFDSYGVKYVQVGQENWKD